METQGPDRFTEDLLRRPEVDGWDVVTGLRHFAIVTYAVDPERVRPHVQERFELDTQPGPDGRPCVWVSAVPFEDADFHFAGLPWLKFGFGQTNYRTYVIDRQTGKRAVWFFGTTLGGWPVLIPRLLWKLPWHFARFRFRTEREAGRYTWYEVETRSAWGEARLVLEDSGRPVQELAGCEDLEAGLVKLTHPMTGVYFRRDGLLGTYAIWHDRLECTEGAVVTARFGLLDRLGLVPFDRQTETHSVLIQAETEFVIQLPPQRLR